MNVRFHGGTNTACGATVPRYSRQIILPDVGGREQRKLLESRVLLIGAGGLGSPAGLYLAAAGVGTLGFVDFDVVDISNLHRQILHTTEDLGRSKTQSAVETVQAINPDVEVIQHPVKLTSENALGIFSDYDVIIDGSDNLWRNSAASQPSAWPTMPVCCWASPWSWAPSSSSRGR